VKTRAALTTAVLLFCALIPSQEALAQDRSVEFQPEPIPGSRLALVIGNSNYVNGALRNPVNDARAMAAALRESGFDVIDLYDQSKRGMEEAVRDYGMRLRRAEVGLFYYAGHGIRGEGVNYLVPIGAQIEREPDVRYEAVDANFLLDQLDDAGNPLNMVILDACRNNPYTAANRSGTRGLASINAPSGTLIAYSTSPGSVAADGTGENSPYTAELLRHMRTPNAPVELVFKAVRESLDGQQTPWESSSLTGHFAFFSTESEARPAAPHSSSQPASTRAQPGTSRTATNPGVSAAGAWNPNAAPADAYEELVAGYLDGAYESNLQDGGYGDAFHKQFGSLEPGESEEYPLDLPANSRVAIHGVCDNECSKMDFQLLSPDGRVLTEDLMDDDLPLVLTTTGSAVTNRLRVTIPECSAGPCYYAFGMYRQGDPSTPATSPPPAAAGPPAAGRAPVNPDTEPQNSVEEAVLGYLNEAYDLALKDEGYTPFHRQFGNLQPDASEEVEITLPPRQDVAIWGMCDVDCSDMNLTLHDEDGTLVSEDVADDDTPLLMFTTGSSVNYRLRVSIPACSRGPCFYVFGVYQTTGGQEPDADPAETPRLR
jgi:uncharacterized caspase-like protein